MITLTKLEDGSFLVHSNYYNVYHMGDKDDAFEALVHLGVEDMEAEAAFDELDSLGHDTADFGINLTFVMTHKGALKAAGVAC